MNLEDKYIPEPNSGCWIWLKALDRHGYGQINYKGKSKRAHRIVFEHIIGPIPPSLVLDHKCGIRCCVNPDHLEPVTLKENLKRGNSPSAIAARKTHCKNGHEFNSENTRYYNGRRGIWRQCRICDLARNKVSQAKKKIGHLPVVRNSFCNPYTWGWHRFLWGVGSSKGTRY